MHWILGDWHQGIPAPWLPIVLAFIAIVCGAIVGIEREKNEKSAGLRTMTLVALGSALFTLVSAAVGGPNNDPGRIAAQIVTGIGFLGAGAILRGPLGVQGLTTAATIWALAATGMLVGAGYALAGLGLSLTIVGVLSVAAIVERRYLGPCRFVTCALTVDLGGGKALVKVGEILGDYRIPAEGRRAEPASDGRLRLQFSYCHAHKHHRELLTRLSDLPAVQDIQVTPDAHLAFPGS